jgi:hypothetical protein
MLFSPLFPARSADDGIVSISLNRSEFKPGEEIVAEVRVANPFRIGLKGNAEAYITDFHESYAPNASGGDIDLPPGKKSDPIKISKTIAQTDPPGLWRVVAEVKDKSGIVVARSEKPFFVTGTDRTINAELMACADAECSQPKSVFIKGEKAYLKLFADIADYSADAAISEIGIETKKKIELKNGVAEIPAERSGGFLAEIAIAKEGYAPLTVQKDFSVIDQALDLSSPDACDNDGKCAEGETFNNCPADCPAPAPPPSRNAVIIAGLAVLALVLVSVLFWIRRRRHAHGDINGNNTGASPQ